MNPFYPREEYESTYEIPFERLYERGVRGLIFDIDNTLVLPDAPADLRSRELFRHLRALGFKTCLVSNNREKRVKSFADDVVSSYVYKADKPAKRGYRKAMERMGTACEETVSIGDQIFTDIWGANLAGIYTILVKPFTSREEIQIVLKRILEKPFLYFYHKSRRNKAS